MKRIILSADGDSVVYAVPDEVADNLREFCIRFTKQVNPKCYTEADFIDWLNKECFPEQQSKIVENLGWAECGDNLPDGYKDYPGFNF